MPDQALSLNEGLVEEIKNELYSQEFLERNRQRPQDFTRKRILTFTLLILFLVNFVKRALQISSITTKPQPRQHELHAELLSCLVRVTQN